MVDPYHFDTGPDPGPEKIRYGSGLNSGSSPNFHTYPSPGKKGFSTNYQENLENLIKKTLIFHVLCAYHFSSNNQLN